MVWQALISILQSRRGEWEESNIISYGLCSSFEVSSPEYHLVCSSVVHYYPQLTDERTETERIKYHGTLYHSASTFKHFVIYAIFHLDFTILSQFLWVWLYDWCEPVGC